MSLLEFAAGIPVMTTLRNYVQSVENKLHIHVSPPDLNTLLTTWLGYPEAGNVPPTWRNLFDIIRRLHLDDLAQRMETYLSTGAIVELSPTRGKQGELGK